jgi:AraC-like DNA-binding protein
VSSTKSVTLRTDIAFSQPKGCENAFFIDRIPQIISYINKNYEHIALEQCSDHFNISARYLAGILKKKNRQNISPTRCGGQAEKGAGFVGKIRYKYRELIRPPWLQRAVVFHESF